MESVLVMRVERVRKKHQARLIEHALETSSYPLALGAGILLSMALLRQGDSLSQVVTLISLRQEHSLPT